jgi:hypothetical protein
MERRQIGLALVCKTSPVPYPVIAHAYERNFAIRLLLTLVLISDERRELSLVQNRLGMPPIGSRYPEPDDGPSDGQDERHRDGYS